MRLAAIDLGSNSIHMVIVEVSASGAFQVKGREKQMVRLGAGTLTRGRLPAEAMRRGLAALKGFRHLAETQRVDKVIAVATSAIREAGNGEDFLERVGRELGVWPLAISGEEEARLIYLAALHSIHLEGRRTLVVDLGGGSVELALGAGRRLDWVASEKLGVLRMTEQFVKTDPLAGKEEERLQRHVEERIEPQARRIRDAGFDVAVGTSGTILALGALAHELETGTRPESLHHLSVPATALRAVRKRLTSMDLRGRLKLPGLDDERADIAVAGSIVLDTLLSRLGVERLVLCEWALREGILLDYIHGHKRSLARAEAYPDVRRRSVMHLAERCLFDEAHARQVAALSLALFDGTRSLHGLADGERALLEFAALLHDIGHHISHPGHHKHSYYLIKNGGLRGFEPLEVELLANLARYHRRGTPGKKHACFAALPKPGRKAVRVLAGLLRLADALDRSHRQVVRSLAVGERNGTLRVRCEADGDCDLEMWGVARRIDLLQQALGRPVRVDAQPAVEATGALRVRSGRG